MFYLLPTSSLGTQKRAALSLVVSRSPFLDWLLLAVLQQLSSVALQRYLLGCHIFKLPYINRFQVAGTAVLVAIAEQIGKNITRPGSFRAKAGGH